MSNTRLPSEYAREMHAIVTELGYSLARRDGGHLVYSHPEQPNLVLPSTPKANGHGRRNDLARLKQRHPDYFAAQAAGSPTSESRRRAAKRAARRAKRSRPILYVADPAPGPAVKTVTLERPGCLSCGYEWKSDWAVELADGARPCPRCPSGVIVPAGRYVDERSEAA